jgi:putative SOS response-associated peptidase YedK
VLCPLVAQIHSRTPCILSRAKTGV